MGLLKVVDSYLIIVDCLWLVLLSSDRTELNRTEPMGSVRIDLKVFNYRFGSTWYFSSRGSVRLENNKSMEADGTDGTDG